MNGRMNLEHEIKSLRLIADDVRKSSRKKMMKMLRNGIDEHYNEFIKNIAIYEDCMGAHDFTEKTWAFSQMQKNLTVLAGCALFYHNEISPTMRARLPIIFDPLKYW